MESAPSNTAQQVAEVTIGIDYHIIEHFSRHLYSSPYKAIEELVTNGFDAGASWVQIYKGGGFCDSRILIWDNGQSMDILGLQGLWTIADSPKNSIEHRQLQLTDGKTRKIIGKFGIGKIASYTIADSISHLCKAPDGKYYLLSVNYGELINFSKKKGSDKKSDTSGYTIQELDGHREVKGLIVEGNEKTTNTQIENSAPEFIASEVSSIQSAIRSDAFQAPVFELTEGEAIEYTSSLFDKKPDNFNDLFNSNSWTIAILSDLKKTSIYPQRMAWVLGNGMPIQSSFNLFLNSIPIVSKIEKNLTRLIEWDFSNEIVQKYLTDTWQQYKKDEGVEGEISFRYEQIDSENPDDFITFAEFPNLGKVWGRIILYNNSLLKVNSIDEEGRSHGFFVFVRKRLINFEDDKLLLNDPSYGTFYSVQFILNIDDLDEELLADRTRFQQHTLKYQELSVLQKALYKAIDNEQRKRANERLPGEIDKFLPVNSREFFLDPLATLWQIESPETPLGFEINHPPVKIEACGKENSLGLFSSQSGFSINTDHPYYANVKSIAGSGIKANRILSEFELVAVSEQLFKGYLYNIGIDFNSIEKIMAWRDDLFRRMALNRSISEKSPSQLALELEQSSYQAGKAFEIALVNILRAMGFDAERDGTSGQKDIFLKAYCGDASYKLIFEAKALAKEGSVPNDAAETGGAASHCKKAGASHAIIVAREFAGFKNYSTDNPPAILQECLAIGNISIITVKALQNLLFTVLENGYSLETIKPVLTIIESPQEKLDRIEKLQNSLYEIHYGQLLDHIWKKQSDENIEGDAVAIRTIWQEFGYRKRGFEYDNFRAAVEALEKVALPNMRITGENVHLNTSPDIVVRLIENKLALKPAQ